jgi:predicted DNA-binding transcriptional regulator YafY
MSKLERVVFINRLLRNQGRVTINEIVDEFSVSRRQAARDIDYLRYSCGAPLEYDPAIRAYHYVEPFDDFDFIEEDALLSRVLIHKLALSNPFLPFNASEIDRRLKGFVPPRLAPLEAAVRFELSSFEPVNRPLISAIMLAMSDKRRASIEYTDIADHDTARTIEPRRLVNYSGAWYCYAVDVEKVEIRNFKLSRVCSIHVLDTRQTSSITDKELDTLIEGAYGAYKGPKTVSATVRFHGPALAIVEHEIWHPDQSMAKGSDTDGRAYLELTLPVFRFEELLGRVLRFGSNALPIAPSKFLDVWKEEIRKMNAIISQV